MRRSAFLLAGGVAHLAHLAASRSSPASLLVALLLPGLLARLALAGRVALAGPAWRCARKLRSSSCCWRCINSLQAAHHLLRLAAPPLLHLPGPRRAQVFQHVLQLRQQLAGLVARAAARQLAGAVEHALQIAAGDAPSTDRPAASPASGLRCMFLGERLQIAVERLAQLLHQPLDLGVGRVLGERVLQLLLQPPQIALGERHVAVLDAQRGVPQQLLRPRRSCPCRCRAQPLLRQAQREKDDRVVAVERRPLFRSPRISATAIGRRGIVRQLLALVDDRAGDRVVGSRVPASVIRTGSLSPVWPSASVATSRISTGRPAQGCGDRS